jgi:hypothetical protein
VQHRRAELSIPEVVIELMVRQIALPPLVGHCREFTGVAFARDAEKPTGISAVEDATSRIWRLAYEKEALIFHNGDAAVRAVAWRLPTAPPYCARPLTATKADGASLTIPPGEAGDWANSGSLFSPNYPHCGQIQPTFA